MQLFTEDPEDKWVTDTLKFLTRYFSLDVVVFHTNYPSNMPALTRKANHWHFDSEEEEEGSDNEGMVGILARHATRCQAAQEEPQ